MVTEEECWKEGMARVYILESSGDERCWNRSCKRYRAKALLQPTNKIRKLAQFGPMLELVESEKSPSAKAVGKPSQIKWGRKGLRV